MKQLYRVVLLWSSLVFATAQIDLTQCGSAFSCFRTPNDCASVTDCDGIATFRLDTATNKVVFELASKNAWVGFAQKPAQSSGRVNMVGLRGQYCARSGSNTFFGNYEGNSLGSNASPTWKNTVDGVAVRESSVTQNILYCRYERDIVPSQAAGNDLYALNTTLSGLIAFGDGINDQNRPNYHGISKYLTAQISNFLKAANVVGSSGSADKIKAHGSLMILAWVLFATCGIFMSRYMKPRLTETKLFGKAAWFSLHQILMTLALGAFIAGFVVILVEKEGWSDDPGKHHWFGLFAVIFGLIQPVMAMFRCAPDDGKRFIFNWLHRSVGMIAWVLGELAIIYGLDLFGEKDTIAIVFLVGIVVLFVILDVAIFVKRKRDSSTGQVSYGNGGNVTAAVGTASTKESTVLQEIFMLVVLLFSIAVTIYEIYLIA